MQSACRDPRRNGSIEQAETFKTKRQNDHARETKERENCWRVFLLVGRPARWDLLRGWPIQPDQCGTTFFGHKGPPSSCRSAKAVGSGSCGGTWPSPT